jgi:hypothetical protein
LCIVITEWFKRRLGKSEAGFFQGLGLVRTAMPKTEFRNDYPFFNSASITSATTQELSVAIREARRATTYVGRALAANAVHLMKGIYTIFKMIDNRPIDVGPRTFYCTRVRRPIGSVNHFAKRCIVFDISR